MLASVVMISGLSAIMSGDVRAQDIGNTEELADLSLEELLSLPVTSATKSSQSFREAPAIITVITAEQIKERGYQNVGEALSGLPGLDLLHDHYQFNLGVRGISPGSRAWSRSVKVMIDGQPVSFRPSQEVWLGEELIPIQAVERIEVIKGPGSVLYGANAYLGVISIITKNGGDVQYGQLTATHGFGARLVDPGGAALVGAANGGWDALGAAGAHSPALEGYQLVNLPGKDHPLEDERSQSGQPLTGSGFAKLSYASETAGKVAFDLHYQQLDRYTEFMDWGVMAHDNRQSLYNLYGRLKYSRAFGDSLDGNLGVALANGGTRDSDRLNDAADDTHVRRKVGYRGYDAFADVSYHLRELVRVAVGADYTYDDQLLLNYFAVSPDGTEMRLPPPGTPSGRKAFTNIGLYAHGVFYPFHDMSIEALRSLELIAGARYDKQSIYGDNFNYSAGLVYQITDALYTKFLVGSSFRAPSSTQLYSNFIDSRGVIGNPDLRPERARTLDLALGGSLLEYFTFEVDGFMTAIKSKVETRPDPSGLASNPTPQNLADIDSMGVEASLSAFVGDLSSYTNYSYQKSTSEELNPFFGSTGSEVVSSDTLLYPTHMWKFGMNYKIPAAFIQANVEGRYISKRLGSESNNAQVNGLFSVSQDRYALPAYFTMDLLLSSHNLELLEGHETRLTAKVSNLLDTKYSYPGYQAFDIPGFVRSYMISLSQQF